MTSRSTAPAGLSTPPARPYIGGQAVLEGVMMRAPSSYAVVVRRRDGSLHVRERSMVHAPSRAAKLPFVRGLASLVESLKLGGDALRFSAELYERDHEDAAPSGGASVPPTLGALLAAAVRLPAALALALVALVTRADGELPGTLPIEEPAKKGGRGSSIFMVVLMVGFLVALPQAAAAGANRWAHLGLDVQSPGFQALTGAFKLSIVVGYLLAVRRLPDIRRVFQYHGAEHKTISAYEENEPLDVAHARAKTTLHPRCGTTFLVMVALMSIAVFTCVGAFLPRIHTGSELLDNVAFFFEKLPFVPVIAMGTFELQRLFAKYCTTGPLRALLWPGFLVQKITTVEPDDDQLEVALTSLRATLFREAGTTRGDATEVRFRDFSAFARADGLEPAALGKAA